MSATSWVVGTWCSLRIPSRIKSEINIQRRLMFLDLPAKCLYSASVIYPVLSSNNGVGAYYRNPSSAASFRLNWISWTQAQVPKSSSSEVDITTIGDMKLRQDKTVLSQIQGNNKYSYENSCHQPSCYQHTSKIWKNLKPFFNTSETHHVSRKRLTPARYLRIYLRTS